MANQDEENRAVWSLAMDTLEPFLNKNGFEIVKEPLRHSKTHDIVAGHFSYTVVEKSKKFDHRGDAVAEAFNRYVAREGL
jgi:hypothetical protein